MDYSASFPRPPIEYELLFDNFNSKRLSVRHIFYLHATVVEYFTFISRICWIFVWQFCFVVILTPYTCIVNSRAEYQTTIVDYIHKRHSARVIVVLQ